MHTKRNSSSCCLRLLGPPHVRFDKNDEYVRLPNKACALLGLLILKFHGTADRSVLATILWENADERQSRSNLRQLLFRIHRLEKQTGVRLITVTDTVISYDHLCAACDVAELFEHTRKDALKIADDAFSLFRGEFLQGISFTGSELEDWLRLTRANIQDRFVDLILSQVPKVNWRAGEALLRRLMDELPTDDKVCRALVTHLVGRAEMAGAHHVYQAFLRNLGSTLKPEPDTVALYESIKNSFDVIAPKRRPSVTSRGQSPPTSETVALPPDQTNLSEHVAGTLPNQRNRFPRLMLLNPTFSKALISKRQASVATSFVEDITFDLCRRRSIATIAPFSARQVMVGDPFIQAKELDVDYVVQFQISPARAQYNTYGSDVRISLTLIHIPTNRLVWGDDFAFSLADTTDHFRALAAKIAHLLVNQLDHEIIRTHRGGGDATAYTYFLLGQEQMRTLSLPNLRRARKYFRKATSAAPEFSAAISATSRTLTFEWILLAQSSDELLNVARTMAQDATEIDPFDGNGYREFGRASLYLGNLDDATEYGLIAESYLPRHADLLADLADTFIHSSDIEMARTRIEIAADLNPLPPDEYHWIRGGIDFFAGNYLQALRQLRKMRNLDNAYRLMSACAAMAGDKQRATQYRQLSLSVYPDFQLDVWLRRLPLRDPKQLEHYADALRIAGFT